MAECKRLTRKLRPMADRKGDTPPFIDYPCGICGHCMTKKRNEWTMRLKMESEVSHTTYFITLTYENSEIPYSKYSEETLEPEHITNFIKRVRKNQDTNKKLKKAWARTAKRLSATTELKKIRYYAVGEYGTKAQRPHYHIIFFNLYVQTAKQLQKLWTNPNNGNPYGLVDIKIADTGGLHYITKYHINKHTDANDTKNKKRHPPFTRMSRMPAIGTEMLLKKKQWIIGMGVSGIMQNGFITSLPQVFKDKIYPNAFLQIEQKQEGIYEANKQKIKILRKLQKEGFLNPLQEYDKRLAQQEIQLTKNALKGQKM